VPAASAFAVSSGGFGGRPANPDPNNPRSESIFIYTLKGGQTKEDQVLVTNNSDETATIVLYAVDGVTTNTGAYTCKQKSEARVGIGEWLKLSEEKVTLAPSENRLVNFSLTMPENTDVGEHNGCIVFESADDPGEVVNGGSVRLRTRSAIRVAATIPGDLRRNIEIDNFAAATVSAGHQDYTITLGNNGNVSADVDTKVTLTNMLGDIVYQNGGGYPVFSNQKLDIAFTNKERPFWGGWFRAQATISYDKRAGTFGTDNTAELITKRSKEVTLFIMPSTPALLIIATPLIILIGVIIVFIWRRQGRRRANKQWSTYIVQQDDTIESVAEQHKVSWKKLASINKIKAPYSLKKGQELKAPATRIVATVPAASTEVISKKTKTTKKSSTGAKTKTTAKSKAAVKKQK
jgi:hypothetical protein